MKNPYPKFLPDEVSGITYLNCLHTVWQEGFDAARPPKECYWDDCQQNKDRCCDCYDQDLYLTPDQPDIKEDR